MLQTLKKQALLFAHGILILIALIVAQMLLDFFQISFFLYNPPIGFALFLMASYIIQPLILGALNIILVYKLYNIECRIREFWINGLFLFLAFSSINLVLQTVFNLPLTIELAVVETLVLAYPFGLIGKLSNT